MRANRKRSAKAQKTNEPKKKEEWTLEEDFFADRQEPHHQGFMPGPRIRIWSRPIPKGDVKVTDGKCVCWDPPGFVVRIEFHDHSDAYMRRCRTCLNNLTGRRT